eukprot:scaffold2507_cov257-Ochromonas_danica.AAC.17
MDDFEDEQGQSTGSPPHLSPQRSSSARPPQAALLSTPLRLSSQQSQQSRWSQNSPIVGAGSHLPVPRGGLGYNPNRGARDARIIPLTPMYVLLGIVMHVALSL